SHSRPDPRDLSEDAAMKWVCPILLVTAIASVAADRPAMPAITRPVMFNTPEADKILAALSVYPPDNPWNEDISKLLVQPNSAKTIAGIGANKPLAYNLDMSFILVPPDQKKVPVKILSYAGESDPGPYPVPDNAPIEDWPLDGRQLAERQRAKERGDRHV